MSAAAKKPRAKLPHITNTIPIILPTSLVWNTSLAFRAGYPRESSG